jgi:hypothetical protein
MDRREHHRVQLRLPARLRWTTPFGQKTEVCETVNVSRGGLLVPCQDSHAQGKSLWVTFPYDAAMTYGQPEILAKVMRSIPAGKTTGRENEKDHDRENPSSAGSALDLSSTVGLPKGRQPQLVALRFQISPRRHVNGNSNGSKREVERRLSTREQLAVPVRVRPEHVPWFEETMTIDCSVEGLRFRSNREYTPGQYLVISFESPDASPWPAWSETSLMVVRVEREPQSPALHVAVCRSQQFSFQF